MARVRPGASTAARRLAATPGVATAATTAAAALLLAIATACTTAGPSESRSTPSSRPADLGGTSNRIGALFLDANGSRGCTASVVDSPHHNLLVTAAHCVYTAANGRLDSLVFAPGFRNGEAPYGSWKATTTTVDPRWAAGEDPEYDIAFVTVDALDGRQIQDVLGGNPIATDAGFGLPVSVTGYPNESQTPITCSNRTSRYSATQERFDCHGYTDGTSGSPWLTPEGKVVGVIGGYQQGGDTDQTSYSITFDHRVTDLYRQATA
ncbi:trypsin-like peptidase domain-containing protein [Kitasatospora sp. MAP5-34]|uniref:trypsin-like serine peptidase n=1 Tax=Kitasatospora sp. MAP5-34 TaxID=3035102 RepID=UPI0024758F29|nr:trypsin-like peptidase domain-containing protein [Kitasatospora sp. MAP5-34]MDH6574862.1 V8-like Glu-specific endopeptidase [Kitasatospora sp. MAP5-34]